MATECEMWRPRHWSTRSLIRQKRLLDVQTSELAKQCTIGKSRHCLTVEAVCNTLVDALADTVADVEATTLFNTVAKH